MLGRVRSALAGGPAIHPFLFAVFPVLFLWSQNLDELSYTASPADVGVPVGFFLGVALVAWVAMWLVLRDWRKAGILVAIGLALLFFYGRVFDGLTEAGVFTSLGLHQKYFVVIWLALSLPIAFLVIRAKSNLVNLTNFLNIAAAVLVAFQLGNVAAHEISSEDILQDDAAAELVLSSIQPSNIASKPDIYYIILDGYTSSSNLQTLFAYDNQEFDDFLASRGFYVAEESRSNYGSTQLSLSSSLSMQHLTHLDGPQPTLVYVDLIKESAAMKILRGQGYEVFHFKKRWMSDSPGSYGDTYIGCEDQEGLFSVGGSNLWRLGDFSVALIQTTLLEPFLRKAGIVSPGFQSAALCDFQRLEGIIDRPGPKFVFAHLLGPHPPFVFGPDGRLPEPEVNFAAWESQPKYVDQLIYNNRRMEKIIDSILSSVGGPSVIVIQGDHGSAFYGDHLSQETSRERFPIINAYNLPGGGEELLYPSVTPVNTFRIIFNRYLGTDLETLDDTSYYTEYNVPGGPYLDVTDQATSPWASEDAK